MYDIESLYEATSVADACRALAADPTAEVIAGGTDVLVKLREGKGALPTWSPSTSCMTSSTASRSPKTARWRSAPSRGSTT